MADYSVYSENPKYGGLVQESWQNCPPRTNLSPIYPYFFYKSTSAGSSYKIKLFTMVSLHPFIILHAVWPPSTSGVSSPSWTVAHYLKDSTDLWTSLLLRFSVSQMSRACTKAGVWTWHWGACLAGKLDVSCTPEIVLHNNVVTCINVLDHQNILYS